VLLKHFLLNVAKFCCECEICVWNGPLNNTISNINNSLITISFDFRITFQRSSKSELLNIYPYLESRFQRMKWVQSLKLLLQSKPFPQKKKPRRKFQRSLNPSGFHVSSLKFCYSASWKTKGNLFFNSLFNWESTNCVWLILKTNTRIKESVLQDAKSYQLVQRPYIFKMLLLL